jgi:hypothetical protein
MKLFAPLRNFVCLTALSATLVGNGRADIVKIFENPGGIPTVKMFNLGGADITSLRATVLADSGAGFLHFTLADSFTNLSPGIYYTDIFADTVGGTLRDRLIFNVLGPAGGIDDVRFAVFPKTLPLPPGAFNQGYNQVFGSYPGEVGVIYWTGHDDLNYHFVVVPGTPVVPEIPVPEPSTLVLTAAILLTVAWLASGRNNRQA